MRRWRRNGGRREISRKEVGREGREAEGAGPGVRRLSESGSEIQVEGGLPRKKRKVGATRGASVGEEALGPGVLEGLALALQHVGLYWSFSNWGLLSILQRISMQEVTRRFEGGCGADSVRQSVAPHRPRVLVGKPGRISQFSFASFYNDMPIYTLYILYLCIYFRISSTSVLYVCLANTNRT